MTARHSAGPAGENPPGLVPYEPGPLREHPLLDRPFEFLAGVSLIAAGLAIVFGYVAGDEAAFAPSFLREAIDPITVLYACLGIVGGALDIAGLILAYRGDPLFGRSVESAGHVMMLALTGAYSLTFVFGEFAHPSSTMLLCVLSARSVAGAIRALRLWWTNRKVKRAMQDVVEAVDQRKRDGG